MSLIEPLSPLSHEGGPTVAAMQRYNLDDLQTVAAQQVEAHGLSRRSLLRSALGVAGLHILDTAVTKATWPGDPAVVDTFIPVDAQEKWLVVGGLGQYNARPMAHQLRAGTLHDKELHFLRYSQQGDTFDSLAGTIQPFLSEDVLLSGQEYFSAYLNSMGGVAFMESLRVLAGQTERPRRVPPIGRLILNCSPFDLWDVYARDAVQLLADIPYKGSAVSKMTIESLRRILERHETPEQIMNGINTGVKQTLNGLSPQTWLSQIAMLSAADLMRNIDDFKRVITPRTQALFCLPYDFEVDKTVDVRQAFAKWYEFFDYFGVRLDFLRLKHAVHADTNQASKQTRPWLDATQAHVPSNATQSVLLSPQKNTPLYQLSSGVFLSSQPLMAA